MRLRTIAGWGAISSRSLIALAGCQPVENANAPVAANSNVAVVTNTAVTNTTAGTTVAADPAVETTEAGGVKTETRTFGDPNSPVERVVVTTREGKRTARVYSRKGEVKDLPENDVERALTATGDALGSAAGFVTDKSKGAYEEAKDTTKGAYEATKEGAEKVADKTGEVAGKVADKTGNVAETVKDKTVSGAKTVGEKTADGAKTVGEKTADGAKTAGKKTVQGVKKVGGAIKDAVTP